MADFERSTTVGVGPDAAYAFVSDPLHLADYVPMVTHVESTVVDGGPTETPDAGGPEAIAEARFSSDAATQRVEWRLPGPGLEGSIEVGPGVLGPTSKITIRLHVDGDVDETAIEAMLDQAVGRLRQGLSGR